MAEGPRGGAPCRVSAFGGGAVTRTMVGPAASERERARGGAGPCCAAAARRAVVGDWAGPFGWPGCLPRAFPFFFEPFSFSFSGFCRNRKRRVFGGIFL